jgi:hypothetical protein
MVMAEAETALQKALRHVAEQEARVSEQEQLITRLMHEGHPTDHAEDMLVEMCKLLDDMRDHLARLRQKPEG